MASQSPCSRVAGVPWSPSPITWEPWHSGCRRCSPCERRTDELQPTSKGSSARRPARTAGNWLRSTAKPIPIASSTADGTAWSPDVARDVLRIYVIDHLGASQGPLIVDETGSLKKGMHSAGIGRPYSETVGRIGNCAVGIFVA
ncbi:MAG: transposase [Caldilineaceae bacterium]|nr:transposase [Caldilineaceae bacterium]